MDEGAKHHEAPVTGCTPASLSRMAFRRRDFEGIIRHQLSIIEDALVKAPKFLGRNVVVYQLPKSFGVSTSLKEPDTQRLVYSAIIRDLIDRGFEVKILLTPKANTLYIIYHTEFSAEEVEAMNAVLKCHRIDADQVHALVEGTGPALPAPNTASAARAAGGGPVLNLRAGGEMTARAGLAGAGARRAPPSAAASTAAATAEQHAGYGHGRHVGAAVPVSADELALLG